MSHHPHSIDRRQLLAGVAALAAFVPFAARGEMLRLGDLVDGAGAALPRGRALAGTTVTLRGYLAPIATRDGIGYALSEGPAGPCPLCGELHDPGATLRVEAVPGAALPTSLLQVVTATGRLEIDGGVARLSGARFA
jgi:hypothetical protein